MEEILQSLVSPAWWFTTIIVAIAINVVAAYLKGPLDAVLARLSSTYRNTLTMRIGRFRADVDKARSIPSHGTAIFQAEVRSYQLSVQHYLIGCFSMMLFMAIESERSQGISPWLSKLLFYFTFFAIFCGYVHAQKAHYLGAILTQANTPAATQLPPPEA